MKKKTEMAAGRSTVAALLESMRAVQAALTRPPGLSSEQQVARLQEWQQMVTEVTGELARLAELATLYEIIMVLHSSLNLEETLGLVMDSLIHLTEAERGCLMLLDEEGNREIRAAQNFDQESVDACELKLSHTVVRDAVETRGPVLTTNAQLDSRYSERESVVGYQLRSIVCVPLCVQKGAIGALYLDNRMRDGVFSEADLPILTAFATHAAMAIENARLYTITDEALAARVEELTTLQQIDRELNASLDFERVLDLTLSWAMQATGAEEGALTILDDEGAVRTISCTESGCPVELESEVMQWAMSSQEPVMMGDARMVVPIRYEDRVLGLLDLRRNGGESFRPDHVQFASQLADHAAVAIENARLYEKVQQANRAKSEYISFVAHELRVPMTSIKGYADLLEKGIIGPLSSQQEEFVQAICRNAERMRILVSDVQDVSRIETGHLRLEMQPTALAEAVESGLQATQAQIEDRSQQLTLEVPQDLPLVHADPGRLAQVLINLLSNASMYTPEGGHIGVRAWLEDGYVHCAVADTGIGISPEDQARLFTKFFRSEDPAVRKMSGTGLGLWIVKHLVELQGGEIELESQLGEGTTVTFTVPVASG